LKPPHTAKPDPTNFTRRIVELRQGLLHADPRQLERYTGATFIPRENQQGEFQFNLWNSPTTLSYPDFIARQASSQGELSAVNQALLLYYFTTADGTPLSGRWISFSELPNGRFYAQAFQGYTGNELGRAIANDQSGFEKAAESLGGVHQPLADASYAFQALPRAPVLIACWKGDEDFPSNYQVLFDGSASHYLPTDAYAILGSTLIHRLLGVYHAHS